MAIRLANSIKDIAAVCKLTMHFESTKKVASKTQLESADLTVLLSEIPSFEIKCVTTNDLSVVDREQIFSIFECNMKTHYVANWGWNPAEKRNELFHPMSRFLLVHEREITNIATEISADKGTGLQSVFDATNISGQELAGQGQSRRNIIAFASFRFEWDDEEEPEYPVLYCYELQVSSIMQGHGIGKQLMTLLVQIADRLKMWKVLLTCFTSNSAALKFYRGIGFDTDTNSPLANGFPADYDILSNRPKLPIIPLAPIIPTNPPSCCEANFDKKTKNKFYEVGI